MRIIKLLLISSLASIIPGQLVRIPLGFFGAITISDIFVAATSLIFTIHVFFNKKSPILPPNTLFAFLFTLSASASTIMALNFYSTKEVAVSSLFLLRFVLYFAFSTVVANIVEKKQITSYLNIFLVIGLIFTLLGFIQFIFLSDLSFLTIYGWDPHIKRIAATLLDPNFTGGLLTFFFCVAASLYIFSKNKVYALLTSIFFSALILTFSRSSYLAFFAAILMMGLLKSPKILIVASLTFLITFLVVGQVRQRVIGAVTLDETSTARLKSWQNASQIFMKNPLFGVGFNTYRFAQARYGHFSFDEPQGGHSGAGSDSSLLTVLATTGIVGFFFYLLLIVSTAKIFSKNLRKNSLNLAASASFFGILVHSIFVNSLFFPQIMLTLWFLAGLSQVKNR